MIKEFGHVLFVDHDEINQMIIKNLLEHHGIHFSVANNGEEALRIIEATDFNCVLITLYLPQTDVFELIKTIRTRARTEWLPIIGLTEGMQEEQQEYCLELGMNDFLIMPIDADAFLHKISKWLNKINQSDQFARMKEYGPFPYTEALDIIQALTRLNFTMQQYSSVLIRFRKEFSDVIIRLKLLVDKGEADELRRLVHTLRGASGFMSANKVFIESSRLEEDLINQKALEKLSFAELDHALLELESFIDLYYINLKISS